MAEAYHPDFWVAVAAAAPVLLLAHGVALNEAARRTLTMVREEDKRLLRGLPSIRLIAALVSLALFGVGVLYALQGFDDSLRSLANTRDAERPGHLGTLLLVSAVCAVTQGFAVAYLAMIRAMLRVISDLFRRRFK